MAHYSGQGSYGLCARLQCMEQLTPAANTRNARENFSTKQWDTLPVRGDGSAVTKQTANTSTHAILRQ
jgi:hypothetical protein